MNIEILSLILTFGGTVIGYVASHLTSSGRAKARAEAEKAMKDNYEERIASLHKIIEANNEAEVKSAKRRNELNAIIEDKVEQIRIERENLLKTERENTRLAEENGLLKEELAKTRCCTLDCDKRFPPNAHTEEAIARKKEAQAAKRKARRNRAMAPQAPGPEAVPEPSPEP